MEVDLFRPGHKGVVMTGVRFNIVGVPVMDVRDSIFGRVDSGSIVHVVYSLGSHLVMVQPLHRFIDVDLLGMVTS